MNQEEQNRMDRQRDQMMAQRQERRQRRIEARKRQQRQSLMLVAAFLVILVILLVILFRGCGKKNDEKTANESSVTQNAEETQPVEESGSAAPAEESSVETSTEDSSEESSEESSVEESSEESSDEDVGAKVTWDLTTLDNTEYNFGYSRDNRDENNVPTDWQWYENQWGEFNVDWIQDTDQNIIYLTMDEGFPNEYTTTILDILEEKDVKATFFLTKMFLDGGEQSFAQIQRMLDLGCVLGNHTCTHPAMPELSIDEQTEEIMGVHNVIKEKFDYDLRLFRFPEGKYSAQSLGLVDNLGYKTCFWSYAYNDYSSEQPPVQESYEAAVNALHPGAIYLLHANSSTNTAFLADWIDAARAAGFEFGVYPLKAN